MRQIYIAKFGKDEQYKDRYSAARALRKFTGSDAKLYRCWRSPDSGYVVKDSVWYRMDTITTDYFPTYLQRCLSQKDSVCFINKKESLVGAIR